MANPKTRAEGRSYNPSTAQANRSIEQGNSVGALDLAAPRDPTQKAERGLFKQRRPQDDAPPRPEWL